MPAQFHPQKGSATHQKDRQRHLKNDPGGRFVSRLAAGEVKKAGRQNHRARMRGVGQRQNAGGEPQRPRAAQQRQFEVSRAGEQRRAFASQAQQRMLQQREQGGRRELLMHRGRHQPREQPGRRFGERVAAGIVDIYIPALQFGSNAASKVALTRSKCFSQRFVVAATGPTKSPSFPLSD